MHVFLYFICSRQSIVTLCKVYLEAGPSYYINYHYKYIIPLHYKILHSFPESISHKVPQALAIASELAISLRRWSNIDNWHAECDITNVMENVADF